MANWLISAVCRKAAGTLREARIHTRPAGTGPFELAPGREITAQRLIQMLQQGEVMHVALEVLPGMHLPGHRMGLSPDGQAISLDPEGSPSSQWTALPCYEAPTSVFGGL